MVNRIQVSSLISPPQGYEMVASGWYYLPMSDDKYFGALVSAPNGPLYFKDDVSQEEILKPAFWEDFWGRVKAKGELSHA